MDLLKALFFVILLATTILTINLDAAFATNYLDDGESKMLGDDFIEEATISRRGLNRCLAQNSLAPGYTCDKFPTLCRLKGSAGPDCCKKKCVNIKKDRLNCGMCGYRCKYAEICCKGQCVNASFDKKNCDGCQMKCKKGEF